MTINPFHDTGLFVCPLKKSGNLWISYVFQGGKKETSALKWVKYIFNKYFSRMLILRLVP